MDLVRNLWRWLLGALIVALVGLLVLGLVHVQANQRSELRHLYATGTYEVGGFLHSLFQATQTTAQRQQYAHLYGGAHVRVGTLEATRNASRLRFLVVVDVSGHILAKSGTVPPTVGIRALARESLYRKSGLGVGGVRNGVLPLAIAFPVRSTHRVLVQGSPLSALSAFFQQVLNKLPLNGGTAVIVDRAGTVLAGVNQRTRIGARLSTSGLTLLARHPNGSFNGHFYVSAPILDQAWRVVLVVPNQQLYAPVRGAAVVFPWLVVGAVALLLVVVYLLALRSAAQSLRLRSALDRTQNLVVDLEQVASATSHDIRGSLRRIIGFTAVLARDYAPLLDERGKRYVERSVSAGRQLDALTRDLVEYARAGDAIGPRKLLDMRALVGEAIELLGADGAAVRVESAVPLYGNPAAIRQVFQNLIGNALKFCKPGAKPVVEISGYEQGGLSYVRVRDYGIGIEPQYRNRVFEPFKRLYKPQAYEGTGIGLALVKRIVERHGGEVRIIDTPDGKAGTVFEFRLPTEAAANGQ